MLWPIPMQYVIENENMNTDLVSFPSRVVGGSLVVEIEVEE